MPDRPDRGAELQVKAADKPLVDRRSSWWSVVAGVSFVPLLGAAVDSGINHAITNLLGMLPPTWRTPALGVWLLFVAVAQWLSVHYGRQGGAALAVKMLESRL